MHTKQLPYCTWVYAILEETPAGATTRIGPSSHESHGEGGVVNQNAAFTTVQ